MQATILIVEDDTALSDALQIALLDEGYRVRVATNGHIALVLHREEPAHLILSDVRMPELSGHGLLNNLRSQGDTTPFILMSANELPFALHRSIPFLRKPFDLDTLFDLIESTLSALA